MYNCKKLLQACVKVCAYVRKQVEKIKNSMDGKNVDTVLMELGVRFHRLTYEHLQQYSYSCMGGMLAICDVAEYRKCAKDFKVHINKYELSLQVRSEAEARPLKACIDLLRNMWGLGI